jgi:hypothetical protein
VPAKDFYDAAGSGGNYGDFLADFLAAFLAMREYSALAAALKRRLSSRVSIHSDHPLFATLRIKRSSLFITFEYSVIAPYVLSSWFF